MFSSGQRQSTATAATPLTVLIRSAVVTNGLLAGGMMTNNIAKVVDAWLDREHTSDCPLIGIHTSEHLVRLEEMACNAKKHAQQ